MSTFGERLRELRKYKVKKSQKEFGEIFGLSESAIGMYERNERKPDYETLEKMATYLDTSVNYLITGKKADELINVAGKEIKLTPEEYEVFKELKKHPTAFHDIMSDPERKVKQLIKMWEALNLQLKEIDEDDKDYLE
ncbi:helix-turn-helix domain-containing protein [Bacillus thuringiensis]|nr:helix-turn-helix domain-containing protein [Bacillus thuringiensis]